MSGSYCRSAKSLNCLQQRTIFLLVLTTGMVCASIASSLVQIPSMKSISSGSQIGNFVLYEEPDGKPVGEFSTQGRSFFFLEDGTLLNTQESARNIFLHLAAEQDFIRDHNLTIIAPLMNYIRFTGDDAIAAAGLPGIESLSDKDCDWPFQVAILFKSKSEFRIGYSFIMLQSNSENLQIGCGETRVASFAKTKLRPASVTIYPDPLNDSSFFVVSNSTPCIRRFTSFGRLTQTCKNDPLFVVDASFLEDIFEKFTSTSLSSLAAVNLIEGRAKPILSLMQTMRNP